MEESAQRRERLKAMRIEASQEGPTHNTVGEHSAVSLSNPLLEPTANPSGGQVHPLGQSFNYYTNPMAAYSGNKQKTKVSPQTSHEYSSIPPRPQTNEPYINHSPIPRMQPPHHHGQYQNPNFFYTPGTLQVQGGYPSPGGYGGPHFTSGPGHGNYPGPGPGYPLSGPNPGRGYGYPGPGPHFRAGPNHGPSSGPGYPTSSPNQGRSQWSGNNMGRGRGRWSGQGVGCGANNNHVTAEDRPDMFYNKSMVEDPWKFLEPVIWKPHKKPKPWNLYSSNIKKPRVSEPSTTGSQPSLAEILAASFNDAASGEPDATAL